MRRVATIGLVALAGCGHAAPATLDDQARRCLEHPGVTTHTLNRELDKERLCLDKLVKR